MGDTIMDVGDIIKELEKYPKDTKVKLSVMSDIQIECAGKKVSETFFHKGYTYGVTMYNDEKGNYVVISGS